MGAAEAIGIVGGGQLAWMLAQAAQRQGVQLHVQTPGAHDPAVALAASVVQADVRDVAGTAELARRCGAISFENEWVDLDGLAPLAASGVRFLPSLEALRPLVCKRSQRELLQRLNLPSPRWFPLDQLQQHPPADSAATADTTVPATDPNPASPAAASAPPAAISAAPSAG
ncbi:MAG: 5-(carboxyamino)imidazole ribonucleotide synthase, partial [Vulcanococcus sp.]